MTTYPNFRQWMEEEQFRGQLWSDDETGVSYHVEALEKIASKITSLSNIPIRMLIDASGKVPGRSDEADDDPAFFQRVHGLDLKQYQSGNYPPIMVAKTGGEWIIIDGRHRVVNFIRLLGQAGQDIKKATIRGYVFDMDNPQVLQAMQVTRR
jgi:hypothetical protein